MPELPEVEAITRRAARHCLDQRITAAVVVRGRYLEGQLDDVIGKTIQRVYRRGKRVLFQLDKGWIDCHNAMSGYWDYAHEPWTFDYVEGKRVARASDVRVGISLENGNIMQFHDSRLFGRLKYSAEMPRLGLGPEALVTPFLLPHSPVMSSEQFVETFSQYHGEIKPGLMNQSILAGVGNIYAAEACAWAGIRPDAVAGFLGLSKLELLFQTLQELLSHNIPEIRYNWLKVYRKKTCLRCGGAISKIEQEGRSTWFCPICQK